MVAERTADDLISASLAKQWLTPEAARKARWLILRGLNPEQALVGTGLLSVKEYGDTLAEITGQPFVREQREREEPPLSLRGIVKLVFAQAEEQDAQTIRLEDVQDQVAVFLDTQPHTAFFEFPHGFLSPLLARLQREAPSRGWSLERERRGLGEVVILTKDRAESAHPLSWSTSLRNFEQDPQGLLIIVNPDDYVRARLENLSQQVSTYEPTSPDELELVQHAALLGTPLVAVLDADDAWYQDLAEIGVPIKVVKSTITPEGRLWEAYPL